MITLITGAPGAGKTAALMDLLNSEGKRRALYVDGIPDLKLPHIALEKPREWMTAVEDGAAVVIDEVQRIWRPRGSASAVPADVAALETHRHKGLDFYLVTQHPNLLDANVRRLVGRHVHLRDVGLLGRWWYEWPEATNPEQYRTAPVKKSYRLPKKVFGQYKSASLHVKPVRSVPMPLIVLGVALVLAVFLAFKAWGSIGDRVARTATKDPEAQSTKPTTSAPQAAQTAAGAQPLTAAALAEAPTLAPKVVGCMAMKNRCACFDETGHTIRVEWELCQTSAQGFGGVVPIYMGRNGPQAPNAGEVLPTPQPAQRDALAKI